MNLLYFVLGSFFLLLVIVDLLWTTVWVEQGAGQLTSQLMSWTWKSIRKVGSRNPLVLTLSGPLILILGLSIWISFLLAGWALIFASADGALVHTVSSRSISWPDLLYFTGYTIFTLGNGDLMPSGAVWQLATVLATASGMLFVTLSVTYVLSVLGAVTQKRSFARGVHGLGTESTAILRTSWDGNTFQGLDVPLNTLATELNVLTSNHKAYPILHYFYSGQRKQAPTSGITVLDEALTLLRFGVSEQNRPNEMLLSQTRSSTTVFPETRKRHAAAYRGCGHLVEYARKIPIDAEPTGGRPTDSRSESQSGPRRPRRSGKRAPVAPLARRRDHALGRRRRARRSGTPVARSRSSTPARWACILGRRERPRDHDHAQPDRTQPTVARPDPRRPRLHRLPALRRGL